LDIVALALSLVGFLGLITVLLQLKSGAARIDRLVFLGFLALACVPFATAFVRTPKLPYLFPPVVAIFLLYPIAAPHGIVYSTDPIFNFSFTNSVVASGFWAPGTGNAFARGYSFYPLGNVFVGYVILTTGLPPIVAYLWVQPILRLLAVPAIAFAIGRRLFGTRIASLGLFFYLGTASILFNLPVQQGMGVIFVGLSLLCLIILTQNPEPGAQRRAMILFALVGGGIVMTHHLSSYIFAGWLAALGVLMARYRFRPSVSPLRLGVLFLYFFAVLGLYIFFFTYSIFLTHEQTLDGVIANLIAPEAFPPSGPSPGLGRTFSQFEVAWLAGSVLLLLLLALLSIYRYRRSRRQPFAVTNGLVAAFLVLVTLPLIATPLNYVPLRISEYANLFVAPLAAATLIRWTRLSESPLARFAPRLHARRRWLSPTLVVLVSVIIFMGGNLAPLTMRMYFEEPLSRTTDTPLNLGVEGVRAADWARLHFGSARIWGDQLSVNVFSGFADMEVDFGSLRMFENSTLDASAWAKLSVGDYIAVDRFMLILRPNFFHEPSRTTPLSPADVEKFDTDSHFALVYQDATFSIYRVMSKPPS